MLENWWEAYPRQPGWSIFSATMALVDLHRRGMTHVDCYGIDWKGTADYDGVQAGQNRGDDRWKQEMQIWDRTVSMLFERGMTVKRITR